MDASSDTGDGESISTAVVLAAGEGTRLRPLTAYRPKPMLPVAGRPILEHVFDALIDGGISEIHVVVGYKSERVQSHFGPTYRETPLRYHTQAKQLGSGHALLQAQAGIDDAFLCVNGDQIIDAETVTRVCGTHEAGLTTLAVVESDVATEYGAVTISGDRVTEFVERPREGEYHLLNAGVYVFDPAVFDLLSGDSSGDPILLLPDILTELIKTERGVRAVQIDTLWRDATYPWDLISMSRELLLEGYIQQPKVDSDSSTYIAESAHVHPQATVVGPTVLCEDVVVEAGAVVGPNCSIGTGSTIGAGSVVRDSVLDAGCRIGANVTAVQLVAGEGVIIGDGATIPRGPGSVIVNGAVHENVSIGAVLADRVTLGGAAATTPGSLVGPDASIGVGVVVDGQVDRGQEVVR